jgi:hypothetical protein
VGPSFCISRFFLSLFICQKDTARFGEASSLNDVIEIVIVVE